MNENLKKAIEKIKEIEDEYNVSVISKSGAYGASTLVIRDNETGDEVEYDN